MSIWEAFLLGVIQGVTEFLPVSSSGHLALGQYFLGFENLNDYIFFDLICHLGTLMAIFLIFFSAIKENLSQSSKFLAVVLGTLPLFPLLLIMKPIKNLFDQPELLGPCFLISAGLIFASVYWRFPISLLNKNKPWQDPLAIGIFQAIAILPGISRSGATISAAQLLGWQKEKAIQFSFLLAIPAILGGTVLEGWKAWHAPLSAAPAIDVWPLFVGFATSFVVGCLALWLLIKLVLKDKWVYFAWYCLFLGLATSYYFNFYI